MCKLCIKANVNAERLNQGAAETPEIAWYGGNYVGLVSAGTLRELVAHYSCVGAVLKVIILIASLWLDIFAFSCKAVLILSLVLCACSLFLLLLHSS